MSFKTKALGLVAATALSLSLTTGVLAQEVAVAPTAVLEAGDCNVRLGIVGTLGTWAYTGLGYERTSAASTSTIDADVTAGSPAGCNVTVSFAGLTDTAGNVVVGLDHFTATLEGNGFDLGTLPDTAEGVPTGEFVGVLTLESVPSDLDPGTYKGRVAVTFSNAA